MSKITLLVSYNKNDGLVISPSDLLNNYLFGIPTCSIDNKRINADTIRTHIFASQDKIENLFSIKLKKQVIEESQDFIREEFNCWGYVKTTYPVRSIWELKGYINDVMQTNYPKEWLSIKKTVEVAVFRNVYLVPNSGSGTGAVGTLNSYVYNGVSPHLGWFGQKFIPNYWRMKYVTGWDNVPNDLLDVICKFAAINVLNILGDILYGVGMTSINISLDGVSQNTPLARSSQSGLFGGRVKQYIDEINTALPNLKNKYHGITFEVL